MEQRLARVNISSAGGSAGAGAKTCKVTLPISWLSVLGIGEERRQVLLSFDGEQITITPTLGMEEFAQKKVAAGDLVYALYYYDDNRLCSVIYADFTDQTLQVENHTGRLVKTAFGKKNLPTWADFEAFLEERCVPRGRAGLRDYPMDVEPKGLIPLEVARPFRISFNRQRNTAISLFGPQLSIPRFGREDIQKALIPLLEYYPQRDQGLIGDRVSETILFRQKM